LKDENALKDEITLKDDKTLKDVKGAEATTTDSQRAILDNVHPDKYYNYSNWLKFIWAIKFALGEGSC
jgi:hypothetical protein